MLPGYKGNTRTKQRPGDKGGHAGDHRADRGEGEEGTGDKGVKFLDNHGPSWYIFTGRYSMLALKLYISQGLSPCLAVDIMAVKGGLLFMGIFNWPDWLHVVRHGGASCERIDQSGFFIARKY